MMISFKCECGNCDPAHVKEYDGALGYAAVVCQTCGRYSTYNESYPADEWSKQYIVQAKPLVLKGGGDYERKELRKAGFGMEAMGFEEHAAIYLMDGKPAIAVSWMDGALAGFSVAKQFRGRGIGTQFIRELLEEEKGKLRVIDPNEKMVKLLQNLGAVTEPDGTGTVTLTKGGVMEKDNKQLEAEALLDYENEKKWRLENVDRHDQITRRKLELLDVLKEVCYLETVDSPASTKQEIAENISKYKADFVQKWTGVEKDIAAEVSIERNSFEKEAEAFLLTNPKNSAEWFKENSRKKDPITQAKRELLEEYHTGGNQYTFQKQWVTVEKDVAALENHMRTGGDPESEQKHIDDNEKEATINNTYLLNRFKDNPGQTQRVTEQMLNATEHIKKSKYLEPGTTKKIVSELNSEAGADVIRYWADKPKDLIYAGACMAMGGDPYLLKEQVRPESHPTVDEEFQVNNKHLMKEVDLLPDYTKKYQAAQEELSKKVFYSQITYSDKKKIVDQLNSPAGAELIAQHCDQAEVTIFASLCAAENGNAASLDKYPLKEEVKQEAVETGRQVVHGKDNSAAMEL